VPTAPYGSWRSPIDAALVASGGVSLDELVVDGDTLFWLEGRPLEGGRQVLCRSAGDQPPREQLPPQFNVRTRVHEYGGGSYAVHRGTVLFSNFSDQRFYRQDPDSEPRPITPEPAAPAALRYADATLDPDGAWLVCVRESHDGAEVTNELVALPADGSASPRVLAAGRDFYASPRLDPSGRRLAWLEWDHPRMPWDGTECKLAGFDPVSGRLEGDPALVAGGPDESVAQPAWSPDGVLHFVSDSSGWWNLYRAGDGRAEPLAPLNAEFAMPQWTLDQSTYAFLPDGTIACVHGRGPVWRLGLIAAGAGGVTPLDLPFTAYYPPRLRTTADGRIATFGSYTTLCALTFHDVFAAGASYFGVADAETLARDTHKFESRYLDSLIGPYPQAAELYRQRSPIHHTELLSCPVILLQGLEDAVVPPAQAERMASSLEAKGIPHAYLAFDGEQHGFRGASTIRRALEAELYFYGRILGFDPADQVEPVAIRNL
jgi:dipeptidyl aminopeptidase/acylaminoacyl peptidase